MSSVFTLAKAPCSEENNEATPKVWMPYRLNHTRQICGMLWAWFVRNFFFWLSLKSQRCPTLPIHEALRHRQLHFYGKKIWKIPNHKTAKDDACRWSIPPGNAAARTKKQTATKSVAETTNRQFKLFCQHWAVKTSDMKKKLANKAWILLFQLRRGTAWGKDTIPGGFAFLFALYSQTQR